ncbi:ubiquitin carboxyl-terminal hydrolase CYLD-like protein [Sarcoptes scabiei]|uniref:ubiquitinyl hydrolase 1 n=1 Tax=Sarcoptes scabiei TaxID=52283 RepID=A0A132A1M5_SARSC|nr:ubiquitin carboxyl-terminal hydrolase CYLD-like protein [Sarcoptes scabiei]
MPSNNNLFQSSTNYFHQHKPGTSSHESASTLTSSAVISPSSSSKPLFVDEICLDGKTQPPSLKIGDRVVWLSDNGPEYGVVKWLGKLPDVGNDWMAGVDFVNPVGSGIGQYNNHQLFQTKMNHASLVPIIGLIRASDFQGAEINDIEKKDINKEIVPPIKPKRTKYKTDSLKNLLDKTRDKVPLTKNDASLKQTPKNFDNSQKQSIFSKVKNLTDDLKEINLVNKEENFDEIAYNKANCSISKENKSCKTIINVKKENPMETQNASLNVIIASSDSIRNSSGKLEFSSSLSPTNDSSPDHEQKNELFEIGSVVQVKINSRPYHGVIRWLGFLKNDCDFMIESIRKSDKHFKNAVAGIELEEEISGLTSGTLNGKKYFHCPMNKAYFVSLEECSKDERFCSSKMQSASDSNRSENVQDSSHFGSIDCPTVLGDVPPLNAASLAKFTGKNRGIQGHHNSCYLDATLFAMFSFTSIFESLLNRPKRLTDIPEYSEVQRILKEEIVNPLRANHYVRADRVMRLRKILDKISSVRGLTSEEKDPEEFINLLLNEILKTDPFLKLSSGLESSFYQLFIEKDESLQIPNVQQLFDQSFLASDIKLLEVPACLMIQMPRFGRDFKMYSKIQPSLFLDVTNVLDNSPRQCIICGRMAQVECKECFGKFGKGLDSITYCAGCLEKTHIHKKRLKHKTTALKIPSEFAMLQNHTQIPRVLMELFAVLCIETSHYVSFVKCGNDPDSPWCFFDSMADRKGEKNGYNIPEVIAFPDLKWWLSKDAYNDLLTIKDEKLIPELPRRLFSDAYICFYSSDVNRYR